MKENDVTYTDILKAFGKAVLSVTPNINLFYQIAEDIRIGVLQRRYEKWQKTVNEKLAELSDEVRSKLSNNENFATTFLKATELASQTNSIKMTYLANAIKFSAENDINEDSLIILLNCMSRYTVSHFKILLYFSNPAQYIPSGSTLMSGHPLYYFYKLNPEFSKDIGSLITDELYRDGFITSRTDLSKKKQTTNLGDLFLHFFGINADDYHETDEK